MAESKDKFDYVEYAETYEEKNAKATIPLGKRIVELASSPESLGRPIMSDSIVHDNACGPGIIADAVLSHFQSSPDTNQTPPPKIHCTDSSPPMLAVVKRKAHPSVTATDMSCTSLSFPSASFTHSFTSLAIFLFSPADATKVAGEIHRTLQQGGVACLSTVKRVGWLPPFQRAQARVRPAEANTPWQGLLPPEWSTKEHVMDILESGGFEKGKMHIEALPTPISMEDFLARQAPMVLTATTRLTEGWDEEEKTKFRKALAEEVDVEAKKDDLAMEFWIVVAKK